MRCEAWNPNMAMFSGNCALFASSLQSHVSEQWNILLRFALRRAVRPACALTHLLKTNSRATVAGHCAVSAKPAQCSLTLFGHRKWPAEARSDEEAARTMAVTRAGYCFLCVELKVFLLVGDGPPQSKSRISSVSGFTFASFEGKRKTMSEITVGICRGPR